MLRIYEQKQVFKQFVAHNILELKLIFIEKFYRQATTCAKLRIHTYNSLTNLVIILKNISAFYKLVCTQFLLAVHSLHKQLKRLVNTESRKQINVKNDLNALCVAAKR